MQPVLNTTVRMKIGETGKCLVNDQQTLKVRAHPRRGRLAIRRLCGASQTTHGSGQGGEGLIVERDSPRTAQPCTHSRVCWLQRIIPVPMAIGHQMRARNDTMSDDRERPFDMRPQRGPLGVVVALRVEERY